MDTLWQDAAYGLRRLRRAPGFALVATATLALGIGANAAIFSVIDGVLLRPLPFPEPDRLVRISQVWKGSPAVYSPQNFLDVQAQARSFEAMAAIDDGGITFTGHGAPQVLHAAGVSASFFEAMAVHPALGRGFAADENEPGRCKVAVLGHGLWIRDFGADPAVVGQTIQLNREPYRVVGVAPEGFAFPEPTEVWTPLEHDAAFRGHSRGAWYLSVVGRLKPGVPVAAARTEVATIAARLARQYPDMDEGVGGTVDSLHDATVGPVRTALLVLQGAVGLVLLIACVNVANLLLARVATRESELAVRAALGAGRGRLLRQLLTESVLLAGLGGGAGLFLAWLSMDALLALQPAGVPRLSEVRVDGTVAGFAALLSLGTVLLFGAFPALQTARRVTAQALREGGRGLLGGQGRPLRAGLVVGQMALAMTLLAGAGLLVRSFEKLLRVDPGFDTRDALAFRVSLPETAYPDDAKRAAFFDELLRRLAAIPGVRGVGAVSGLPLAGMHFGLSFEVEGDPPVSPAQQPTLEVRVASPEYFRTLGIPIQRGRGLEATDGPDSPPVVVLSESAVRRHFPNQDPLGKRIVIGWRRPEGKPKAGGEVVGIVADVKEHGLSQPSPPEIYIPCAQLPFESMDVVLRASVSPLALVPSAQAVVRDLDPELPLSRVRSLDDVLARSVSEPRFYTLLLGAFAGVALLLAAIGLFGVMSYAVVQRRREIGVRVALGALPGQVVGSVLREAMLLAAGGTVLGLVATALLSRVLGSLLFELSPTDPATLSGVALLLGAVALLSSYLPARQAARVDPVVALRSE